MDSAPCTDGLDLLASIHGLLSVCSSVSLIVSRRRCRDVGSQLSLGPDGAARHLHSIRAATSLETFTPRLATPTAVSLVHPMPWPPVIDSVHF